MAFLSPDQRNSADNRLKDMGMGSPADVPPADPIELAKQIGDLSGQLVKALGGEEKAEGEMPMGGPAGGPPPPM